MPVICTTYFTKRGMAFNKMSNIELNQHVIEVILFVCVYDAHHITNSNIFRRRSFHIIILFIFSIVSGHRDACEIERNSSSVTLSTTNRTINDVSDDKCQWIVFEY